MRTDFWNNPLVVSAIRLKYRRSSPVLVISVFLLALLGLAAAIEHYSDTITVAPGLLFLLIMFSLQFFLSGIMALYTVSSSMNGEISNRTLDFQRIVSLSPQEILIGKIIGEPTLAYFMLISTIPFAILSFLTGSTTIWTILWLYINLLSFTLMCASLGLLHTLKPGKKSSGNQGGIGGAMMFPLFIAPMYMIGVASIQPDTWIGAIINLLTPIGSIKGLYQGQAWAAYVPLWGKEIPSLYLSPLIHLLIMGSLVAVMAKRLRNPTLPLIYRVRGYLTLLVIDCLQAGFLYSFWLSGDSATRLLFVFGFGHVIACMFLIFYATPSRAALHSWIWRFEKQSHWLRDLWTENRATINGSLLIYCLIGSLMLLLGFVVPINFTASGTVTLGPVLEVLGTTTLLILALGACYQWCIATGGSSGVMVFLLLLLLVCILGPIAVSLADTSIQPSTRIFFQSTSPLTYFVHHMEGRSSKLTSIPWPLLLECGFAWAIMIFSLNRWLARQRVSIHKKLASMI
jgi:hypothetical protein